MSGPYVHHPHADTALPPHPDIGAPGACGAVATIGETTFVCVAAVHATEDDIRAGRRRIDRHYYVNRHPWRPRRPNNTTSTGDNTP